MSSGDAPSDPVGLIRDAVDRVETHFGHDFRLDGQLVSHPERYVITGTLGGGLRTIVKIDLGGQTFAPESLALRTAAHFSIRAPRLLFCSPGPPGLLVLEWVDGTPLSDASAPKRWERAGQELRRLHNLAVPAGLPAFGLTNIARVAHLAHAEHQTWNHFLSWWAEDETRVALERGVLRAGDLEAVECDLLEPLARLAEPEGAFLHGDLQPAHVLLGGVNEEDVTMIDFGDASWGDAVWDVIVLTLRSPLRISDVLRGYQPSSDLVQHLKYVSRAYRLLRWLGEISWLDEHGFDSGRSIEQFRSLLIQPH